MGPNESAQILIVDDEPTLCELLESMVCALGIKAKGITRSLKVMDEVKSSFYHLILLDVFMPEKSGFDLIPDIRKVSSDTKIIIITGLANHAEQLSNLISELFEENRLEYTSDYIAGRKINYQECNVLICNYHNIRKIYISVKY